MSAQSDGVRMSLPDPPGRVLLKLSVDWIIGIQYSILRVPNPPTAGQLKMAMIKGDRQRLFHRGRVAVVMPKKCILTFVESASIMFGRWAKSFRTLIR